MQLFFMSGKGAQGFEGLFFSLNQGTIKQIPKEKEILMKVIICLDERGGRLFNGRRQASDRNVLRDMMRETGVLKKDGSLLTPEQAAEQHRLLLISPFSEKLFEESDWSAYVRVLEDPLKEAEAAASAGKQGTEPVVFVEDEDLAAHVGSMDHLLIYRWKRVYPYDSLLEISLDDFKLQKESRLAGFSHDMVYKELYVKKEASK